MTTVDTDPVLLACIIDAEERRYVSVVDIPNALIHTRVQKNKDMDIIKIRGVLVDILLEIVPEFYDPYVTTDNKGVKKQVLQCQNAIYGTMMASLLYYQKFRKSLELEGYELNP